MCWCRAGKYKKVRLSNLGLGDEGSSRDGKAAADREEILNHDGQTAPLPAAWAGYHSLDRGNTKKKKKNESFS